MSDFNWADREDWTKAWQSAIEQVGTDFGKGTIRLAADAIERGMVRRFLEPLEFDCPLHHDEQVAAAHGYVGILAPYSGVATWIAPAVWQPGAGPAWVDPSRNAQLADPVVQFPHIGPPFNAGFATDIEYEYSHPFLVGDRCHVRGPVLLAVEPKETRVGRGAFLTWRSDVHKQDGSLVVTMTFGMYRYVARRREDVDG